MIRRIFVPLDGSLFAEQALPTARAIAERAGATLHLILVHLPVYSHYVDGVPILDDELDAGSRDAEHAYLQAVQQRLADDGMPAPTIALIDGPVAETLGAYAAKINADLVVMTTHGRGGVARFWLGSVADGFVRHSQVPALMIRPGERPAAPEEPAPHPIRKLLVALDGSRHAEQILGPALALGSCSEAEYTLVQVVDALVLASSPYMPVPAQRVYAELEQRAADTRRYLEALAEPLRAEGHHITTRVVVDPQPALALLREAEAQGCDLIALATHGRKGVRRLVLGSVADKVLRGADLPVLLYHPPVMVH